MTALLEYLDLMVSDIGYVKTHLQNGLKHFCIIKAQSCPRVKAVKFIYLCQQNSRMFLSIYKINFKQKFKENVLVEYFNKHACNTIKLVTYYCISIKINNCNR